MTGRVARGQGSGVGLSGRWAVCHVGGESDRRRGLEGWGCGVGGREQQSGGRRERDGAAVGTEMACGSQLRSVFREPSPSPGGGGRSIDKRLPVAAEGTDTFQRKAFPRTGWTLGFFSLGPSGSNSIAADNPPDNPPTLVTHHLTPAPPPPPPPPESWRPATTTNGVSLGWVWWLVEQQLGPVFSPGTHTGGSSSSHLLLLLLLLYPLFLPLLLLFLLPSTTPPT